MTYFSLLIIKYKYLILFPIAFFEGPITAFFAGLLASLGYLNVPIAYSVLLLGDFVPDTIYYFVGRYGESNNFINRYGKKFGLTENSFSFIKKIWHTHGFKTMFVSKLAYGISTPFLIGAGLAKIPVKKFYRYAVPVTIIEYGILMILGFYFGNSYSLVSNYLKYAQIFFALFTVLFIVGYYFFSRYMKKHFIPEEKKI